MITEAYISVNFYEVDTMGIVYHAFYPVWFEEGRKKYYKNAGIPSGKLEDLGYFLPLSKLECNYKRPARFGDEIVVVTKLIEMSCVKMKFEYVVLNNSNKKVLATGRTVHAWTDRSLKPMNIEKAAPEIYKKFHHLVESGSAF